MIIKIFCMQKNEDDILEDWILYHSSLVGYENIYLIDNQSNEKSKEILKKYSNLINIYERQDYLKKGDYIAELIMQNQCDIAIPLDIDEFIGITTSDYKGNGKIDVSIDKDLILNELNNIYSKGIKFSFSNYLTSINTKLFSSNPLVDCTHFTYENYGLNNKKFFNGRYPIVHLDHGNHKVILDDTSKTNYITSKLIEKCSNDIKGLKSVENINDISELKSKIKSKILGYHNIETYLKYIEYGTYSLLMTNSKSNIIINCLSSWKDTLVYYQ